VILSPDIKLVTVDVFDTVLTRNAYSPVDLFSRVKGRLAVEGDEDLASVLPRFEEVRRSAELHARRHLKEREEITFDEIIAQMALDLSLADESASRMASYEIEEELRSVAPVVPLLAMLKTIRQAGKQIAFVSDMYLPEDVIREMLQRVGALEPQDRLYVSGTIGKKKSTGSLFRYVMDDLGLRPDQIIHLGDYLLSDFLIPRFKCGIRSFPVRIARNNAYERIWGDSCHCRYCSSVAGASRAARTALPFDGAVPAHRALQAIGCNILGPILAGFILWVFQQAELAGVRRLYFLSRDGESMLDVARALAGRFGIEIELRYLYVSRTAVFPALMGVEHSAGTLEWLKEDNIELTLRILADRLKVDAIRLHEGLTRAAIRIPGPDSALEKETVELICRLLLTDSVLSEMASESGRDALTMLSGYLEQERLFDGTPFALVDLGWHGSIQDAMCACFADRFGANGITGYYFGVDREGQGANRKSGYFFNSNEASEVAGYQHLFRVLMELMCSGTSGMVLRHHLNEQGTYEPVFAELEHPVNGESVKRIRLGIEAFLRYLEPSVTTELAPSHVVPMILRVLKKLFFYPSRAESSALGDFRFSADQAGNGVRSVALPFTFGKAVRYAMMRSYAGRSTVSSWFFASWVRSGPVTKLAFYPFAALLRIYFVGTEVLKFSRMKAYDLFNTLVCVTRRQVK